MGLMKGDTRSLDYRSNGVAILMSFEATGLRQSRHGHILGIPAALG